MNPSERESFDIDPTRFVEGPDTWSQEKSEGWKLYCVDTPHDHGYILCRYSWKTNRDEVIEEIGEVTVEPLIKRDEINESFEENGIPIFSDGQWKLFSHSIQKFMQLMMVETVMEKGFDVFENVALFTTPNWAQNAYEYYMEDYESKVEQFEEKRQEFSYLSPEEKERLEAFEPLEPEQIHNLDIIEDIWVPQSDKLRDGDRYTIACELHFDTYPDYKLRMFELVQNSVFENKESVALVYALREEGYTQSEIADLLGRDESTISQQTTRAEDLLRRARWTRNSCSLDVI